ncbi:MAG: hypothetical protein ACREV5_22240 [Steroidobacter sp.]
MGGETETTRRTKRVISSWADIDQQKITLDTKLSRLRTDHLDELRRDMNAEFEDEGAFPITPGEWEDADPKTVRDVRDLADKKLSEVTA